MNAPPVRIALVGYGFGGRYFHAPLLAAAASCELVGVVTTSAERRALVAADHPAVACVASLSEAVDAGAEAVAISTPASTHSDLTDEALDRGLHVVCDKPFSLDAAAAMGSVRRAEAAGLVLSPYQNRRWDSDYLTVRQVVGSGRLGSVTRFESRFERWSPHSGPGPSGGGVLLDFGSHLVDQALHLLGAVERVAAEWRIRSSGLDDDVFVALTHVNGARSHLWGSWSQGAPGLRFRVTGTDGTFVIDGPMDGQESALVSGARPDELGDRWGMEPPTRWGSIRRGDDVETVPSRRGAWPEFYSSFAAAVRGVGEPPVPARDAVATAAVLDAARVAATSGDVVRMA